MSETRYAIIVAGGKGLRMKQHIPKQFLELNGMPILMHTVYKFTEVSLAPQIIVVLPHAQQDYWQELCKKHRFNVPHTLCEGGATRTDSVRNGLALINESEGLVAIHDAVRPLIAASIIENSFEKAAFYGNAITSVPVKDSIRQIHDEGSKAKDRDQYRLVQTPQTFLLSQIKAAYAKSSPQGFSFSDDAGVVEAAGYKIHLIEGSPANIKITNAEDLLVASTLLKV